MSNLAKTIKSKSIILISGLILLSLVLFYAISPSRSSLKSPIEKQLQAIQVEDIVTAYSYTSPAFQKTTTLEGFKKFVNDYSGLRNNESVVFNQSGIKDGIGMVKATLISRGGKATSVTYQLVKARNNWKIESIIIVPQPDEAPPAPAPVVTADNNTQPVSPATTAAETPTTTEQKQQTTTADTTNFYEDPANNYSLFYSDAWEYTKTDSGELVFHKKNGDTDNQALLSIQSLANSDDARISVQQVVDKGEESIKSKAGSYKVVEDGLLPPRANKNENFHGRYIVYSYTLDNDKTIKQLQVIYFKSPSRAKFVLDFSSPEAEFDADLPAIRAIISSFTIT